MNYRLFYSLLIAIALFFSCNKDDDQIASFTDSRDGQSYKIVTIGDQIWMAENLNFIAQLGNSWCIENDINNCDIYGRLYDWEGAVDAAPTGWHLPTESEWEELIVFLGGEAVAGGKLKITGDEFWGPPNIGGDNSSGFAALGAGRRMEDGSFLFRGKYGTFWSATESTILNSWHYNLRFDDINIAKNASSKGIGLSVRCVKD